MDRCKLCGSAWPALTILEAARNYNRAEKAHPEQLCTNRGDS